LLVGEAGFEKEVAVKKILPHFAQDRGYVSMLIDEARISGLVNHPNVIQVYELTRVGDDYLLAMEYVGGADLRTMIGLSRQTGKAIPVSVAVQIVQQILSGLAYVHELKDRSGHPLGIIHRD